MDSILKLVKDQEIQAPAVMVIGEVIHLAKPKIQEHLEFELEDEFIFQNLDTIPFFSN